MKYIVLLFTGIMLFTSCRKTKDITTTPPPEDTTSTTAATTEQLIADSVFLFSKEVYYWQDKIGSVSYETFNPRQYVATGDALGTAEAVIAAVRSYNDHDKEKQYSNAQDYQDGSVSSKAAVYYNKDYGFYLKEGWKSRTVYSSAAANDPNFDGWYVTYVFPNSTAGKAGVQRGMKVTKIGATTMGYTNAAIDAINSMFYDQTTTSTPVEFEKPDGTTFSTTLTLGSYIPTSVLKSAVLTTGRGKKVGYLVYKFFDDLDNSQTEIDKAIQSFRTGGVSDVVIDLRYNNGGYTATQDYLTNLLAPKSVSGNTMYQYYFNANLQKGNYTVLKNRYPNYQAFTLNNNTEKFSTSASLNTSKVYFIVSDGTASAAELLINNLRATNVLGANAVLIGDYNTFGKPVGFFPIDLFKKVTFWTVSFMTKNGSQDSVSYNGFTPDYVVYDGVDKAWGDVTEECLKAALSLIDGKSVSTSLASSSQRARSLLVSSLSSSLKKKPELYDKMIFNNKLR